MDKNNQLLVLGNKVKWILLLIAIVLLGVSIAIDVFKAPNTETEHYAQILQDYLKQEEKVADAIVENTEFLNKFIDKSTVSDLEYEIFNQKFTLLVYEKDSLIFWNNTRVGFGIDESKKYFLHSKDEYQKRGALDKSTHLYASKNAIYYTKEKQLDDGKLVVVLIPIKYIYKYVTNSIYLENIFGVDAYDDTEDITIPKDLRLTLNLEEASSLVKNLKGEVVFGLKMEKPVRSTKVDNALFVLNLLAFILFLIVISHTTLIFINKNEYWKGLTFLIVSIVLLRVFMSYLGFSDHFISISFFEEKISSHLFSATIGDLLINSILVLWVSIFFHRTFYEERFKELPNIQKYAIAFFIYLFIVCIILFVTDILKNLVLETDIPFDFNAVAKINVQSFMAIIGVLLLMMSLFFFTHKTSNIIHKMELGMMNRIFVLLGAISIAYLSAWALGVDLPLILLFLFSNIYILSFDLFVEKDSTSFAWIIVWLIIFSGFSASFIYRYNIEKEYNKRLEYAELLSKERDAVLEKEMVELYNQSKDDEDLLNVVINKFSEKEVEEIFEQNHSIDSRFLFYKVYFHLFIEDSTEIVALDKDSEKILNVFKDDRTKIQENLHYVSSSSSRGFYYIRLYFPIDNYTKKLIILEFEHSVGESESAYTELFINENYKKAEDILQYNFAIYKGRRLVEQNGNGYSSFISEDQEIPKLGEYKFSNHEGKSYLTYHDRNGMLVIINQNLPEFTSQFRSLFAYLFTIMVLVLSFFVLINALVQLIFRGASLFYQTTTSLRNRIQISVILMILFSFIVIGFITIFFFDAKNTEYHDKRFDRKAQSVRGSMAREISRWNIDRDSIDRWKQIAKPVSQIHRTDVNIYSLEGKLIASSMQEVFSKGLSAPFINAKALYDLQVKKKEITRMDKENAEQIGELKYVSQYEMLKNTKGDLIAYLGIPYYAHESKLASDTSDFISTLLNIYVILLLMAGLIAIWVARSITRPIAELGEKMKELKIGKKNEPIIWKDSKDELSELVIEYNKMIQKLEDSAELLAQSEREGAWREMAKQVAHEIKNPLTPMKLSIQYLEYASQSNPDNIEGMIKRVSRTLIEQIDNLSHIATEFSNFAKMPRAENEEFIINSTVQSVYDLFVNEREDVEMEISLPKEKIPVYADKKQLLRVLNNIIKNAIQAIPEDRKGKIHVELNKLNEEKFQVAVHDNGTGIEKDMFEYIFIPHITTKSSGTGLGLAMSKNIVESLGGKIYFKSTVGVGTTFFIEMPIYKDED